MEIVVERAVQDETLDGRTCNCGSNNSGNQGSMCKAQESPLVSGLGDPAPTLAD